MEIIKSTHHSQNSKDLTSTRSILKNIWSHRNLTLEMSKREISSKYKDSIIGVGWSLITPILMLLVYTFVFSIVFQARWGGEESIALFAVLLFTGLSVLNLFVEVVNNSPSIILSNINYVKKVVFPLEILPVVLVVNSMFYFIINLCVLLIAILLVTGHLYWTATFIPIVVLPLVIMTLGFSWIISALGVYLRDISQFIHIITTALLFLSPIFYPITAVPVKFQALILANPLTFIIEQARKVLIWGQMPDWVGLITYTLIASTIALLGYHFFKKMKPGFSDVL